MRGRGLVAGAVAVAVGVASVALAAPVSVPNGGFEEGTFAKWDRFERGGGDWEIYMAKPRGIGPIVPTPPEGEFAALVTQGGPGVNILHRVLKLKRNGVNKLKFQLYYDNSTDRFHSPKSFKFGGGGMVPVRARGGGGADPNQQLRVDLMKPRAKIKSLRKKDILATQLWTKPGDPLQQPYEAIRANMTNLGIDAKRVRLRIAEVDNEGEFLVGVDALTQTASD